MSSKHLLEQGQLPAGVDPAEALPRLEHPRGRQVQSHTRVASPLRGSVDLTGDSVRRFDDARGVQELPQFRRLVPAGHRQDPV